MAIFCSSSSNCFEFRVLQSRRTEKLNYRVGHHLRWSFFLSVGGKWQENKNKYLFTKYKVKNHSIFLHETSWSTHVGLCSLYCALWMTEHHWAKHHIDSWGDSGYLHPKSTMRSWTWTGNYLPRKNIFKFFFCLFLFFFCTVSKLACSECSSKVTAFETTLNWQHRVAGGCLEMGLC